MKIISLLLLCLPCLVNAQNWSIAATGQMGWSTIDYEPFFSENYEAGYAIGGNIGLQLEKRLTKNVALGTGLIWTQISGKLTARDYELWFPADFGKEEPSGYFEFAQSKDSNGGISIPLYVQINYRKWAIELGAQYFLQLINFSSFEMIGILEGEPVDEKTIHAPTSATNRDYGLRGGLRYQLNEKWRIGLRYYHGLRELAINENAPFEIYNRQFSLGVDWVFLQK